MGSKRKEFCGRGHLMAETRRLYQNGTCCGECMRMHSAEYKRTHKEQARRYYEANKEKVIERQKFRYKMSDREKLNLWSRRWRLANNERSKKLHLKSRLKGYGLSVEQYESMITEQHGLCAICKTPPTSKRRLAIDHDHADGHVRQLLCQRCNRGLGLFADSLEILDAAARYVRKHSQLRLVG